MAKKVSLLERMQSSKPKGNDKNIPVQPPIKKAQAVKSTRAKEPVRTKQASRAGKIPISTFIGRGAPAKQFKMLCIEEEKNQQEMLNAMINEYMEKRGKPGIY